MEASQKPTDMIKMLIFPCVYMFSNKIDFKDPNIVQLCQIVFSSVLILVLSIYYFIYTRINAKNDNKTIWVPPKKAASLPFGLSPAAEPAKPADYTKTSYKAHETSILKDAVQQIITTAAISFFIGYQFKIYMSLLVQALTLPLGVYDLVVFRKYVLGHTKNDDGSNLYDEQFTEPTKESIAIAEKLAAARSSGVGGAEATPSVAKSAIGENEPRVEEINEEEEKEEQEKPKKESKKSNSKNAKSKVETESTEKKASAHDID